MFVVFILFFIDIDGYFWVICSKFDVSFFRANGIYYYYVCIVAIKVYGILNVPRLLLNATKYALF